MAVYEVNYLLVLTNGQVAKTVRLTGGLKDDIRLILDETCQNTVADMPKIDTDKGGSRSHCDGHECYLVTVWS